MLDSAWKEAYQCGRRENPLAVRTAIRLLTMPARIGLRLMYLSAGLALVVIDRKHSRDSERIIGIITDGDLSDDQGWCNAHMVFDALEMSVPWYNAVLARMHQEKRIDAELRPTPNGKELFVRAR